MKMDAQIFDIYPKENILSVGYVCACAYVAFSQMIW